MYFIYNIFLKLYYIPTEKQTFLQNVDDKNRTKENQHIIVNNTFEWLKTDSVL